MASFVLLTGCKTTPPAADASGVRGTPGGGAAPAPSSAVAPNGVTGATSTGPAGPPPIGNVLPELAGKWCFMANVDAKDGGRESGTCFTLKDDGTYQFRADGSAPAPFTGSAPPSSEVGHWVATTNTLSVVAASGQVTRYPLAKKNHPKTRDPMLVLSGQPFVTVFQKQPW